MLFAHPRAHSHPYIPHWSLPARIEWDSLPCFSGNSSPCVWTDLCQRISPFPRTTFAVFCDRMSIRRRWRVYACDDRDFLLHYYSIRSARIRSAPVRTISQPHCHLSLCRTYPQALVHCPIHMRCETMNQIDSEADEWLNSAIYDAKCLAENVIHKNCARIHCHQPWNTLPYCHRTSQWPSSHCDKSNLNIFRPIYRNHAPETFDSHLVR